MNEKPLEKPLTEQQALNQLQICASEPAMPSMECCRTVLGLVERLQDELCDESMRADDAENEASKLAGDLRAAEAGGE